MPINGHYINGFIAGDGCLAFNTKDVNFGRMSWQISQHNNNKLLLLSIAWLGEYYTVNFINVFILWLIFIISSRPSFV